MVKAEAKVGEMFSSLLFMPLFNLACMTHLPIWCKSTFEVRLKNCQREFIHGVIEKLCLYPVFTPLVEEHKFGK